MRVLLADQEERAEQIRAKLDDIERAMALAAVSGAAVAGGATGPGATGAGVPTRPAG